jgi:hypothetical protein
VHGDAVEHAGRAEEQGVGERRSREQQAEQQDGKGAKRSDCSRPTHARASRGLGGGE